MKRYRQLPPAVAALLLGLTLLLVLLTGWHREITSRYPIADLPFVDMKLLKQQIQHGNVGRTEAIYYRKDYAGADTTEIR
ncbi:MAG: hypothetical protein RRA15_01305 [bacterium]|nr:hypothetical protein [bacterium]MDT8365115.1 hypothetical protein [bacterium]